MYDVITIGTASLDVFLKVKNFKASQRFLTFPLGEKIEVTDFNISSGGGATNCAVTFKRLGFKTLTVFEVGQDPFKDFIINELQKEKIDQSVSLNKKLPTAYSTVLVNENGERVILVKRGAAQDLTLKEIPYQKYQAKWLYLAPGNISFETIKKLIFYYKKTGAKIALNPSKAQIALGLKKIEPILKICDVVILNKQEGGYLTGFPLKNSDKIFKTLDNLVKGILILTDGKNGAEVSDSFHFWKAGIFKNKKVIDRTGAGDAFGSAFVAGLMMKNENCLKGKCDISNINYALRLASANSTSVVESLGAKGGILTKAQFEKNNRWNNLKIETKKI